ncbi:MAG: XRE family transcriptional regulator [Pseudomonadota bacterium]
MTTNDNVIRFSSAAHGFRPGRLLIPDRLVEARLAERKTQTELANLVGVSRQAVSSYEMGDKQPEPETMANIARHLKQPIGYFTRPEMASFGRRSTLFFRKVGTDTKRRNQACSVYADWLVSTAATLSEYANYPAVDLPSFEPSGKFDSYSEDEIEDCAEKVRQHFGLGWGPISNVVRLLEAKGIVVCRVEMEGENVEAFSFWSGDRPFVFLSSDKSSGARARYDAAHEMGHLCLHRWIGEEEIEDKSRLKEIEREANRFAGAFLLPRRSFPNEVYSSRAESFIDLKARWKAAIQAMVYRCKDLGLFDDRQATNLYKQISYKKWRKTEPLDDGPSKIEIEAPVVLAQITSLLLESGKLSGADIASKLGLSTKVLSQMLSVDEAALTGSDEVEAFRPTLK